MDEGVKLNRFNSWTRIFSAEKLIYLIPGAIVTYLVLPPLALLVMSSFRKTKDQLPIESVPWTWSNYVHVLTSAESYVLFQNSLTYALCTVLVGSIVAVVLVWLIERSDMPYGDLCMSLVLIPLALPGLITAIGWSFLASPRVGVFNVVLRQLFGSNAAVGPLNIYSLGGIIFVSALSIIPSLVLMLSGAFRNFDPALEEASEASGASALRTQRSVTLPLLRPALLGAFIYNLADALDNFQIPSVLGLNAGIHVYSTKIYLATNPLSGLPDYGLASGYSMLLFFLAIGLIIAHQRTMQRQHQFAVVTGKGYRPRRVPLGPWKYLAVSGVGLYLFLGAICPLLVLIWTSLQPYFSMPSMDALARVTLSNYQALLDLGQFRAAITNTLFVSLAVATATMLLSSLTAWMAVRRRFRGSSIPDFLTFVNTAVPSVVFGLAIMLVYLSFPIVRIYGTIWIIIIALTTRYLSFSTRLMGGAVVQIHKELEEASEASGASPWSTVYRITLPLLMPAFLSGWLWVAVHSLREATIAVMLMTPANVVLSALVWEKFQQGGEHGLVAAMSVVIITISMTLTFFGRKALLPRQN